jgi:aspartyl/asparaginyl beta-hydroxylase (cupin superfamily)
MFLPLSDRIDNQKFFDGYQNIKNDYLNFRNEDYFFDYSHDYQLTSTTDFSKVTLPKSTGYFWQVCPLIYNKQILPIVPEEVRNSFTANLIMSFPVLPVLAVFSILEPHSDIDPHIDTDERIVMNENASYRPNQIVMSSVVKYHFSLDIPTDGECALIVGDEKRLLNNRDLNPFDERTTHYAYNHSSSRRGVLIVSYIRKDLY